MGVHPSICREENRNTMSNRVTRPMSSRQEYRENCPAHTHANVFKFLSNHANATRPARCRPLLSSRFTDFAPRRQTGKHRDWERWVRPGLRSCLVHAWFMQASASGREECTPNIHAYPRPTTAKSPYMHHAPLWNSAGLPVHHTKSNQISHEIILCQVSNCLEAINVPSKCVF